MIFNKTDRLALKFIGNSFGQSSEISLGKSSYILHAQLMLVTDSHFNNDLELKIYEKSYVIPYKDLKQNKFSPINMFTINVTSFAVYAGNTRFTVDKVEQSDDPVSVQQDPIWGLVIIYGDPFLPVRHVSLKIGESTPLNGPLLFSELLAPSIGPNYGTLFLFGKMRMERSSIPILSFGPNTKQLSNINPSINVPDHAPPLSRGIYNQEIDISTTIVPAQASACLHVPTESTDSIHFLAIGLQMNAAEPKMNIVHSADTEDVQIGDIVTYTTTIQNIGTTVAECIQFRTGFPYGTTFISDSLTINAIPIVADPSQGLLLRNMLVGDTLTVVYKVKIIVKPSSSYILHQPVLDYNFIPIENTIAVGNQPSNISRVYVHS